MVEKFDISLYSRQRQLIVYGAGIFGEYTVKALRKHDVEPNFVCDRVKDGTSYFGVPVISPVELLNYPQAIILIAAGAQFGEVEKFLKDNKFQSVYSVCDFIFKQTKFNAEELSLQATDIEYNEKLYRFGMAYAESDTKLMLLSLDLVVTERCSLRCKHCSNLMQYYAHPKNFTVEQLRCEMSQVLDVADSILDLRLIGGEPFMNPDLVEVIEPYLDDDKIINISIYTNGSILPNEKMLNILKHPKCKVELTNYGNLCKNTDNFIKILERENIRRHIVTLGNWHDLGKLENRQRTESEMQKIYALCYCNNIPTLLNGKLYICPYSAHGRSLGAIPENEDDVINVYHNENERKVLVEKMKKLLREKSFDIACGYCSGRNNHLAVVPAAEQANVPLAYTAFQ